MGHTARRGKDSRITGDRASRKASDRKWRKDKKKRGGADSAPPRWLNSSSPKRTLNYGLVAPPSLANGSPPGALIVTSTVSIDVHSGRLELLTPTSGIRASALLLLIAILPASGVE